MIKILNQQAQVAVNNPLIFDRIEECVVNAKTTLAKRRLVHVTIVLSALKAIDVDRISHGR